MATPTTKTELLKSQMHELIKSYTTYDGSSRPQYIYVAQAGAANGDSCIRTEYTYDGVSSRVVKRLESYQLWSSAYDI
jgi:hypothetical protein